MLSLLPESATFEDYRDKVAQPFQDVYDSIKTGTSKADALNMLVQRVPSWYFSDVKVMGGSGIVSKGMTTSVFLNLQPGNYAMECYIKQEGVFHTTLGMLRPLTVTQDTTTIEPPDADVDISLTKLEYQVDGSLSRGKNTVAVHFLEQPEVGPGNDVHIVKLNDSTTVQDVLPWLNWMNIEGMEPPAPCKFYGGVQEMPVGKTAYFKVDLPPGHYAWIAESTAPNGIYKEFDIE